MERDAEINEMLGINDEALLETQLEDPSVAASQISPELVTGCKGFYNHAVKRVLDMALAMVLFVCLLPLYLVIAAAIVIDDGFPIAYRAKRGGYKGKTFYICKFRSMVNNADKIGGGTTAQNDKRITRVGNVIRKLKLDELLNLLNILKGEMSFIGPRPELLKYTEQYTGTEKLIFEVRPGLTDYSSIEFINLDEIVGSDNADEMYEKYVLPRKNKLRVKYAATVSFSTDAKLFMLTIWKVLGKSYGYLVKKEHR